jgi:DNA recombination protein RmuC
LTAWANQNNKKTFEIARQAGALYDKFEGFVADFNKKIWQEN